jgi:dihydrofolate reductase
MRKLLAGINTTLDGRCDHRAVIADDDLHRYSAAILDRVDAVLFGRNTYELFMSHWPGVAESGIGEPGEVEYARAIQPVPKIVFSKSYRASGWNTRTVSSDAVQEIRQLKQQPGKDLLLAASPSLFASLREADLIDEYHLVLHPIVAGTGPVLFRDCPQLQLRLAQAQPWKSGAIALTYVARD